MPPRSWALLNGGSRGALGWRASPISSGHHQEVGRELAALGLWGCGPLSSALGIAPWAKAGQAEYSRSRGALCLSGDAVEQAIRVGWQCVHWTGAGSGEASSVVVWPRLLSCWLLAVWVVPPHCGLLGTCLLQAHPWAVLSPAEGTVGGWRGSPAL